MRATDLPGWVWLRGMTAHLNDGRNTLVVNGLDAANGWISTTAGYLCPEAWARLAPEPDLDDPATGGAMLALLGDAAWRVAPSAKDGGGYRARFGAYATPEHHPTLARACLAVALSLGRWPGVREV